MNALHKRLTELAFNLYQTGDPDKVAMAHWINAHVKAEMERPKEKRKRKTQLEGVRGRSGEFYIDGERLRE